MNAVTDQRDDQMRHAIGVAMHEVVNHPEAPEGIEFFTWIQHPIASAVPVPVDLDSGLTVVLHVTPRIRGLLSTARGPNDPDAYYWVGWDRYHRIGVIACGDRHLFPRVYGA